MINGHNQRKLLANFLKFSFLIRRIWTCTPGSVVLLPPSANIHLPCVARWLGSCSEDGACAPEAGYQQPYQTNFTALSHCDPVVGCSVTIASSDQRKKRAKARPVRTLRHPPHRQPVKDTLLWSGETLNPSNTQNNLWIRMVKSVFRNSTDGLSIYIYICSLAAKSRVCFPCFKSNVYQAASSVHPAFPTDSLTSVKPEGRSLAWMSDPNKPAEREAWDIPQVHAKMFIGIVKRPAWNLRHKQCMLFL